MAEPIPICAPITPQTSEAKTTLACVPPDKVQFIAEIVRPFLETVRDCSLESFNFEDVIARCENERSQLWVVANEDGEIKCAFVTELIQYPRRKICRCWAAGGDLSLLARHLDEFEDFARAEGCSQFLLEGRPWIQKWTDGLFELSRVVVTREL